MSVDMEAISKAAIELVADIARGRLGAKDTTAGTLLDLIAQIVERVIAGFAGAENPKDIEQWVVELRADLMSRDKANDRAADDYLDKKFPPGEP